MWGSMNDKCYEHGWMWQDSCHMIQTALFVFMQKGVRPQRKVAVSFKTGNKLDQLDVGNRFKVKTYANNSEALFRIF